jgi:membrane associated rhomboid family serine protease
MFPYRDDNPTLATPVVTLGLIALNTLVWMFVQGAGFEPYLSWSVCQLGLIPGELLATVPAGTSVDLGPDATCVLAERGDWTDVLTSMFLHGGWLHLIGNMWFLWVFGNNVEDSMGRLRFLVFYVLCGAAAAAAQTLSSPESAVPMVGASGAIGGVMGAYVVLYPRVHVYMLVPLGFLITTVVVPAYVMLGYWFVLQLISGAVSPAEGGGVAFWAHAGGFLAGALLVSLFRDPELVALHRRYIREHEAIDRRRR